MAFAPALAGAASGGGGGGGGGAPSFTFPEKLAENIDFQPGGVGCICCSSNATINQKSIRLIQNTDPSSDAPFAARKAGKSILKRLVEKVCCCCTSSQAEQVAENADAIHQLIDELHAYKDEAVPTQKFQYMVGLKARVELDKKLENGEPLMLEDYVKIHQAADELRAHVDTLERMLKQLEYYAISKTTPKTRDTEEKKQIIGYKCKRKLSTKVEYPDGTCSLFKEKKLVQTLAQDIPCDTLSKQAVKGIVEHVKEEIEVRDGDTVLPEEIQAIVVGDLLDLGIKIKKPEFLDEIDSNTIKRNLKKRKALNELSPEEFDALYAIAQQKDLEESSTEGRSTRRIKMKPRKKRRKTNLNASFRTQEKKRVKKKKKGKEKV